MERVIAAATDDQAIVRAADIRVLGPLEVLVGGEALSLGGPKQRALLPLLAVAGRPGLSVERVMDGLWGESPPEAARSSIYSYVSNLRAVLGGGIERRGQQYTLAIPHTIDSEAAAEAGEEARTLLATNPDSALELARAALAMWRGAPYADLVDVPGLQGEIDRLEELRLQLVELRVEASLATGHHAEVIGELGALVRDHPLRERFRMQHMLALYRSGRQVEALRGPGEGVERHCGRVQRGHMVVLCHAGRDTRRVHPHVDHPVSSQGTPLRERGRALRHSPTGASVARVSRNP